eukprot:gene4451-6094_t
MVRTLVVDIRELELVPGPWQTTVDNEASLIIPVPAPYSGVIVVASSTISYIGQVNSGMLITLALCVDVKHPNKVSSLSIDFLGVTSVPETISYLGGDGLVFVGSGFGDSQLIKLLPEKND